MRRKEDKSVEYLRMKRGQKRMFLIVEEKDKPHTLFFLKSYVLLIMMDTGNSLTLFCILWWNLLIFRIYKMNNFHFLCLNQHQHFYIQTARKRQHSHQTLCNLILEWNRPPIQVAQRSSCKDINSWYHHFQGTS